MPNQVNWDKETPAVKEVCDALIRAHEMYEKLPTTQEQNRVNALIDLIIPG